MGARTDIETVLVIGSGPIVIGQACEFDYSGTQACRVLRSEGYRVVLVNPNPATIMTDPGFAHATYVEPLDVEVLEAVIAKERPQALLPTLGGQSALNAAMALSEAGVLERHHVELIGAKVEAIETAESRELFKKAMCEIGLEVVDSGFARSVDEALSIASEIGFPVIVRPSFILGGAGTGVAHHPGELASLAATGIAASPVGEILIERSIVGWKEYELEVMRDRVDNCVVICSIENFDPMGVHTGDSVTVAPAQTLSDVEYQEMRDAAFACIRRIGVETGGSNIQFAIDPTDGSMVVIEMNPRVSRSSALASKATGFPIAKIAAKLAVGYTLDEVVNDITRTTPASFEPTIDYVVTKVPRWAFEKFPEVPDTLGTKMQSVGEAMAIGRTFPESLQKALRSLEQGRLGLNCDPGESAYDLLDDAELIRRCAVATPERPFHLEEALRRGVSVDALAKATAVDPWFLDQISRVVEMRALLESTGMDAMQKETWLEAKRLGFSDAQLAYLWKVTEGEVRAARKAAGVEPTYKTVDTCGAEFEAHTPYHYSTYEDEDEVRESDQERVVILGSGPNRIGQGIEFDYCCVHAAWALKESGYETVMVNCNPETVSTDYDTSDRLYFEPLTAEDVSNVIEAEQRASGGRLAGVVVSLGGQTPLKLAHAIDASLVLGTSPASIDAAEDREQWSKTCRRLGIAQPPGGTALCVEDAVKVASEVGFPVLIRPSYVLGGRAMEIVYNEDDLRRAFSDLVRSGPGGGLSKEGGLSATRPVLVDRFLEDAIEVDVDAVRDREGTVLIGGVMEHVEEAGVHSGDSACVLPPPTLGTQVMDLIERHCAAIATELEVVGLINVQFAIKDEGEAGAPAVYVIEANPRASRTVPFVSKATGVPLAKIAARVMVGASLAALRSEGVLTVVDEADAGPLRLWRAYDRAASMVAVKEAVLPFDRFPDADALLGPEMRSTGEVMGIDRTFGLAFTKSQIAAGNRLPSKGAVFFSLADRDKESGAEVARSFRELGFEIFATEGTASFFEERGVAVSRTVPKLTDRPSPSHSPAHSPDLGRPAAPAAPATELIASGAVQLVVNTPRGRGPRADGAYIRSACSRYRVPCTTTVAAARAAAQGIADWRKHALDVRSLQSYHAGRT
jgi:carbamoyl-phosphate synthase large subunit